MRRNTKLKPSRTTIDCCGTVKACDAPSSNLPLANMPALNGASFEPAFCGRSTYTSAERVCWSTVGAIMRTLPVVSLPLAAFTSAVAPGTMLRRSCATTSARHSRRPWRIMRNSSVPGADTAPTVAVRAEITPLSGATTLVYFRRSCWVASAAWAEAMRALAVCSAVLYWLICWALSAPESLSVRARAALATASAAVACASSRAALACATSALTVSAENTASTSPALTVSPTLTRTSVRRKPFDSLLTLASCQAATLPLAVSVSGRLAVEGLTTVTVSAGLGAAVFLSSTALWDVAYQAMPPMTNTANRARATGFRFDFRVFISPGSGIRYQVSGIRYQLFVAGAVQPPPAARYSATQAALRSRASVTWFCSAASRVRRASSSSNRLAMPFW